MCLNICMWTVKERTFAMSFTVNKEDFVERTDPCDPSQLCPMLFSLPPVHPHKILRSRSFLPSTVIGKHNQRQVGKQSEFRYLRVYGNFNFAFGDHVLN